MATQTTLKKRALFLKALGDLPNVARACRKAGIDRTTAYRWRDEDADFAAAWSAAIDAGIERLEEAAHERALNTSDVLMIFLLKAHRPDKYRENVHTQHSGGLTIEIVETYADPPAS